MSVHSHNLVPILSAILLWPQMLPGRENSNNQPQTQLGAHPVTNWCLSCYDLRCCQDPKIPTINQVVPSLFSGQGVRLPSASASRSTSGQSLVWWHIASHLVIGTVWVIRIHAYHQRQCTIRHTTRRNHIAISKIVMQCCHSTANKAFGVSGWMLLTFRIKHNLTYLLTHSIDPLWRILFISIKTKRPTLHPTITLSMTGSSLKA